MPLVAAVGKTGDTVERTVNSLFGIVERSSRFSKIGCKRIGFDDQEQLLGEARPLFAGDDERIMAWVPRAAVSSKQVRDWIALICGLPLAAIVAVTGKDPPLLLTGKPNFRAMLSPGTAIAEADAPSVASHASSRIAATMRFDRDRLWRAVVAPHLRDGGTGGGAVGNAHHDDSADNRQRCVARGWQLAYLLSPKAGDQDHDPQAAHQAIAAAGHRLNALGMASY